MLTEREISLVKLIAEKNKLSYEKILEDLLTSPLLKTLGASKSVNAKSVNTFDVVLIETDWVRQSVLETALNAIIDFSNGGELAKSSAEETIESYVSKANLNVRVKVQHLDSDKLYISLFSHTSESYIAVELCNDDLSVPFSGTRGTVEVPTVSKLEMFSVLLTMDKLDYLESIIVSKLADDSIDGLERRVEDKFKDINKVSIKDNSKGDTKEFVVKVDTEGSVDFVIVT